MAHQPPQQIGITACLVELDRRVPDEFRLVPAGRFKARDGRPHGLPGWNLTRQAGESIIASAKATRDHYVIDYEHQTLHKEKNGQPAPAAAWFRPNEWRDDGLWVVGADWTDAAKTAIESKEYRYISPVITYNKKTGDVTGVLMAALTNYAAIDGLTDLVAAASALFSIPLEEIMTPELIKLLGLPDDADESAVLAAVTKLCQASERVEALSAEVEALKTREPDPAKYAPVETLAGMQKQIASLSAQVTATQIEKLIEPALADGRLQPAQKDWAEKLGTKDIDALSAYLETAQPIAALKGSQTGGKAPEATGENGLTEDEMEVCTACNIDPEEFKKSKEGVSQ